MDNRIDSNEEQYSGGRYWTCFLLFTILLFFCVFGITYSFYHGGSGDDHEMDTGQIVFTYSDVGGFSSLSA